MADNQVEDLGEFFSFLLQTVHRTDEISVSLDSVQLEICERRLQDGIRIVLVMSSAVDVRATVTLKGMLNSLIDILMKPGSSVAVSSKKFRIQCGITTA